MSRVFPADSGTVCVMIISLRCNLSQESVECLIVNSIFTYDLKIVI
jgi:hypothetical protein